MLGICSVDHRNHSSVLAQWKIRDSSALRRINSCNCYEFEQNLIATEDEWYSQLCQFRHKCGCNLGASKEPGPEFPPWLLCGDRHLEIIEPYVSVSSEICLHVFIHHGLLVQVHFHARFVNLSESSQLMYWKPHLSRFKSTWSCGGRFKYQNRRISCWIELPAQTNLLKSHNSLPPYFDSFTPNTLVPIPTEPPPKSTHTSNPPSPSNID